jgi:hypothetical protein
VAAAPGPAANVPAEAINVVVDEGVDDRLGGVPENPQPRVLNPAPTAGGVDTTGPEITQADVDAAVEALRADLAGQITDATAEEDGRITVVTQPADPVIEGLEGLVGTRDTERVEISATQPWSIAVADEAEVAEQGTEMLLGDLSIVPDGHELLPDSPLVTVGEASLDGEALRVDVTATARAAATVSAADVRASARGRSADEAEAALAVLGVARVELWPGWVTTVPDMDWRVDVRVVDPEAVQP